MEINEKKCRECGECCRSFTLITHDKEYAKRMNALLTEEIGVVKLDDETYAIEHYFPCIYLEYDAETKLYKCLLHEDKELRPSFCSGYPMNMLKKEIPLSVLKYNMAICPELRRMVRLSNRKRDGYVKRIVDEIRLIIDITRMNKEMYGKKAREKGEKQGGDIAEWMQHNSPKK